MVKKILLQCRRPQFDFWAGRIPWRRVRLPTPVFLGFPGGSVGKESARNAGDLDLIPGLGRSPGEGKGYTPPVFWPGEFHGLQSMGSQRVAHASWTQLSDFDFQSTLVFSVFSTEKDFSLSPPAQMWPVSHFQMRMSPPLHPAKEICSSSEPLGT